MKSATHSTKLPTRQGFTLVELIVVVLVIGILVAIIVPTLGAIQVKAKQAQVAAEINSLSAAIGRFKTTYGIDPPSRLVLFERASEYPTETKAIIRRIWPQFDFNVANSNTGVNIDLDADGTAGEANTPSGGAVLNGAQCLVFFLGGMITGSPPTAEGFSKNPANPFVVKSLAPNREGPFMEFDSGRIIPAASGSSLVQGYLSQLPDQTLPYLYFSSYDGRGYRTKAGTANVEVPLGTFADVYRVSAGGAAHKPQSFQIICPGYDNAYGKGGAFDPRNTTNAGLSDQADYDNLTNFHPGRLFK